MLYSGTDPESYVTECTSVYEEKQDGTDVHRARAAHTEDYKWVY